MPEPLGTPVVSVSQMRARRRGGHQRQLDVGWRTTARTRTGPTCRRRSRECRRAAPPRCRSAGAGTSGRARPGRTPRRPAIGSAIEQGQQAAVISVPTIGPAAPIDVRDRIPGRGGEEAEAELGERRPAADQPGETRMPPSAASSVGRGGEAQALEDRLERRAPGRGAAARASVGRGGRAWRVSVMRLDWRWQAKTTADAAPAPPARPATGLTRFSSADRPACRRARRSSVHDLRIRPSPPPAAARSRAAAAARRRSCRPSRRRPARRGRPAALVCFLCIRMKVAPVIGQALAPGWSSSSR